jgi:hypothetical protein
MAESGEDVVAPWQSGRTTGDHAVGSHHEDGRGATDAESAYQVQVRLGIDLGVGDARLLRGDVRQQLTGGAARRAERRGELDEGGPLPHRSPTKVGRGQPLVVGRSLPLRLRHRRMAGRLLVPVRQSSAEPAVVAALEQPDRHSDGECGDEDDGAYGHAIEGTGSGGWVVVGAYAKSVSRVLSLR